VTTAKKTIAGLTLVAMLSSCAAQPIGPTVQVMPAPGKPFDLFAQEEGGCKVYAQGQIAGAVDQANNSAVGAAVLGTVLGAGLGAAVGGGRGAGIGAASGAVVGTGVGTGNSGNAQMTIQQRYDIAYSQCMYSKGNQVPGFEMAPPPAPEPVAAPAPTGPRYDPSLVQAIQTELGRIGLLSATPDGAYGPKTRGAIMDYEKTRGLPRDGIPSQALLDDLRKN
jgi:peptidoglycan hydrolase-like protein with peptidoglycan-binding domain